MKNEKYISNLIGTFATSVSNDIEKQIAELGGRSLSHEAALVTIYNHPNETIDVLSKTIELLNKTIIYEAKPIDFTKRNHYLPNTIIDLHSKTIIY